MGSHEIHERLVALEEREVIFSWSTDLKWDPEGKRRTYFVWHDHALRPYTPREVQRLIERLEKEHA